MTLPLNVLWCSLFLQECGVLCLVKTRLFVFEAIAESRQKSRWNIQNSVDIGYAVNFVS